MRITRPVPAGPAAAWISMAANDHQVRPQLEAVQATVQAVCGRVERGDALGAAEQFVEEVALGPGAWELLPQPLRETMLDGALAFVAEQRDQMWAHVEVGALSNIDCPVLVTQGDGSQAWFRPIVASLADAIDHADVHTYRGAGHAPHLTHPGDYLATVTDFLSRSLGREVEAGVAVG